MYLIKTFFCALLFITNTAFAALELELTEGVDNAMPVTITRFAGQNLITDASQQISSVIANDLKNSGRFRLIDSAGLAGLETIDYENFRAQKINAVVTGEIKATGNGQYAVSFRLFDVYNKNILLHQQYQTSALKLRSLAHHISDLVYQQLTGDRGVFSTKIAYILVQRQAGTPTRYKLQVADSDGFNVHILLTSFFPLMSPTWAPDGKKLAYVSFEGNRLAIFEQEVASGSRRIISKLPGLNNAPAYSPDGTKMAVVLTLTGYPKIYVLDLTTKSLQRITDGWYLDTEPSWSPDGKALLFTSNRGGDNPQIYRIDLSSRKITRVTYSGPYNARAFYVPSSNAIVMLHQEDDMFNIATQDLKTSRVTVLSRTGNDESPSIAPNGKMIVYATNVKGRGILAEVAIDGRVKLMLPAAEGVVQEPAWSPFIN